MSLACEFCILCNTAVIVKGRVSQLFCDTFPLGSYTALLFYLGLFAEKLVDLCQSFVPRLREAAGKREKKVIKGSPARCLFTR